jgi:hypothetical protein
MAFTGYNRVDAGNRPLVSFCYNSLLYTTYLAASNEVTAIAVPDAAVQAAFLSVSPFYINAASDASLGWRQSGELELKLPVFPGESLYVRAGEVGATQNISYRFELAKVAS